MISQPTLQKKTLSAQHKNEIKKLLCMKQVNPCIKKNIIIKKLGVRFFYNEF
jgi:hypothetical protein